MYSSIRISGYRGLDSFRMEKLGRVNLLVGMNNSGKTSILECIELLRSAGDPHVLPSIARRRGELGYTGYRLSGTSLAIEHAPVDVAHLFPSHRLEGEIVPARKPRFERNSETNSWIVDVISGANPAAREAVRRAAGSEEQEISADALFQGQ